MQFHFQCKSDWDSTLDNFSSNSELGSDSIGMLIPDDVENTLTSDGEIFSARMDQTTWRLLNTFIIDSVYI